MKVLIIEDEKLAQDYLIDLLSDIGYELQLVGTCNSLKNSIKWLVSNDLPDLIFMDIDLGDGLCFEIFDVVDLSCPIIFTTAYDEYAIRAFKVNSIDYLLKPIASQDLNAALKKYFRLTANVVDRNKIEKISGSISGRYKSRFIIKVGNHIRSLPVENIRYFHSKEKATYAYDYEKKMALIDYSLDRLESMMDPEHFFRINRNYIISYGSIKDIISYSGSRLKVHLEGTSADDVVVSRDRVQDFKSWLDR